MAEVTPTITYNLDELKTVEDCVKAISMLSYHRGNWQKTLLPEELEPFTARIQELTGANLLQENIVWVKNKLKDPHLYEEAQRKLEVTLYWLEESLPDSAANAVSQNQRNKCNE